MSEWKKFTGSDEQIAEIKNNTNGYIVRNINLDDVAMSDRVRVAFDLDGVTVANFEYWLIPDDPLREMKVRQAQTGQPVWVRKLFECGIEKEWQMFVTTTPDWNIPNAEYSFTAFED